MTDRVELPLSGASFGADPSFVELLRRQRPEAMPSSLQMGRPRGPPGHDRPRPAIRGRDRDGRRSACHRRLHDRRRQDEEGVRRGRLLRDRDRGRGRTGRGDRSALPAGARALREAHGRSALPRREGQPARPDDPRELPAGDAGPRRRPALRWIRRGSERRPALLLRRDGRTVGGAGLPGNGFGSAAREELAEEALAAGPGPRTRRCVSRSRRSSTRPKTTSPPGAPTSREASSRS